VIGLGLGAGFGIKASGEKKQALEGCMNAGDGALLCSDASEAALDKRKTSALIADVGFIVGGIAAAALIGVIVAKSMKKKSKASSPTPRARRWCPTPTRAAAASGSASASDGHRERAAVGGRGASIHLARRGAASSPTFERVLEVGVEVVAVALVGHGLGLGLGLGRLARRVRALFGRFGGSARGLDGRQRLVEASCRGSG
jgi:hypothetical protein